MWARSLSDCHANTPGPVFKFVSSVSMQQQLLLILQVSQTWNVSWSFLAVGRLHELGIWVLYEQQVHLLFLQLADSYMQLQDLPNRYEA